MLNGQDIEPQEREDEEEPKEPGPDRAPDWATSENVRGRRHREEVGERDDDRRDRG